MSSTRCSRLIALLIASALTLTAQLAAQSPPQQTDEAPPASHVRLPEIVRLSFAEGDVRISRGKHDAKLTGNTWEHAVAGIPLQSGFSLATGADGRAEIEFEDTSTLYLAPNSALTFSDLTTRDGVPHTTLALLSGTITTHLDPNVPGEQYLIETATHSLDVNYGDQSYMRITGFLDGMQVTPMTNQKLVNGHLSIAGAKGESYNLVGLHLVPTVIPSTPATTAWDSWVADRITTRTAAMDAVMKQAGLSTPVPGLADLAGKGTFTSCAPYGTCWEPNDGWTRQTSAATTSVEPLPEAQSSTGGLAATAQTAPKPRLAPALLYSDLDNFPCNPQLYWYQRLYGLYNIDDLYPYDWAVCHAGYWIYANHRYHWVVGTHKHHHCPVHWVKYQGKLGYVPVHPRDQRGQPPVNLRHGVYRLTDKPNQPIERVALSGRSQPKLLDSTPKEFRSPAAPLLARVDSPQLAVHMMHEPTPAIGSASTRVIASTLQFNTRSDRFMLATRVTDGGHTHTYTESMTDRGGHIPSPSGGGNHGAAASGFRGGASGGGHSGGGFSGGGSHSGGGSSGGGGGHSGGGSSGGSSSGKSSGGGSHR
ncbi:MAG TPA: FecR domain-containing protein [Acidobacteriaceae bacterium]|nr:FecR domain-containing protein [Acidobacteriaceae bacterium]